MTDPSSRADVADAPDRSERTVRRVVPLLFVLTGMSGLVFEVIWVKQLSLIVGSTTFATSLVVAAFLSGLVAGSLALGRWADRVSRPLLAYAGVEVLTGVSAFLLTLLLAVLPRWLDTLGLAGGGPLAVRLVLPFLLVLPPTFLMGGTLPVLTRFLTRSVDGIGRSFGTLYALNTLGAAFGCGLAGFVLLGELGVLRTGALAAAVNVLVGLGAWLLFRFSARAGAAPAPAPEAEAAAPQVASTTPAARRLLTWAFAFCGFTSIGYEVLWFRVLSTTVESSSYAFTLLLTTFLFGLALGGLLHARRLSKSNQLELFVAIESALALAALVSVALLGHARPLSRLLLWQFGEHGPGSYLAILILSAAVILVPVLLIGVLFPAVVTLTTQRLATLGRDVGLLYSVNTLGGIAGSLAVGFLGIPLLGTQRSFFLLSAMNLAIAFAVLGLDAAGAPRKRRSIAAAGVAVAAVALLLPSDYLLRDFTAYDDSRVLWAKEGRDGTLAVLEYDRETVCNSRLYECDEKCLPEFSERQLIFGSVSYANTILPGKRYMSVLAHLPMLTHRDPRRVLEVCFGTGITASTFTLYPELESLTVVDINPDVFLAAPWFSRDNRDVVTHPKVKLVADDGRHYLTAHRAQYDVISFEPPPPRSPGISSLYSREFYQVIRERLAPGGVLTQWIPLQDSSDLLDKSLIQSLLEVFPHVSLWIPARYEAVLLASLEPLPLDLAQWRLRAAGAPVLQSLEEIGYPGADALLGSFVMGTDALRRYVAGSVPSTDDHPVIEYFLSYPWIEFDLDALLQHAESPVPLLARAGDVDPVALEQSLFANRLLLHAERARRFEDLDEARRLAEQAKAHLGETTYLKYLLGREYACKRKRRAETLAPAARADAAPSSAAPVR